MKKSLLIILLTCLFQGLSAQKKCRDSVAVLHQSMDSLKLSLAEARREWQKCSDRSTVSAAHLSEKIAALEKINEELKVLENLCSSLNSNLRDSLQKSRSAAAMLQKALSDKDLILRSKEDKANALLQKLTDSLGTEIGTQCYLYQDKGDVFLVISDTLVLGGYFFVSKTGRLFLEKISTIILPHFDRKMSICTFSDADTRPQDLWRQSSQKALALLNVFESFKFPAERLSLQVNGNWQGKVNYKKPPIILELKLE
jgi:hypothetical protein